MNTSLLALEMRRSDLPRHKIREHVRNLILTGKLTPGMELLSTRELAAEWKIPTTIVHSALSDLVTERYLIRRHGKGTFVAERVSRLRAAGIYLPLHVLSDSCRWFVRSVLVELNSQFQARGVSVQLWADPRPVSEMNTMWGELESAVQKGKIQGVVLLDSSERVLKWAPSLPVPIAGVCPRKLPFAVGSDLKQMLELGLTKLADDGCRTVGLITNHPVNSTYQDYYSLFVEISRRLGMKIRNSWIRIPRDRTLAGFQSARFGYDEFQQIWNQKDRPDGVLVEPDIMVEGVISAILQRGVKVPQELKVVFHRNESYEYLCPFPVSQLVMSEKAYASALIDQLDKQVSQKPFSHIVLPYRLEDAGFQASAVRP